MRWRTAFGARYPVPLDWAFRGLMVVIVATIFIPVALTVKFVVAGAMICVLFADLGLRLRDKRAHKQMGGTSPPSGRP
jgi:hypothetical protein